MSSSTLLSRLVSTNYCVVGWRMEVGVVNAETSDKYSRSVGTQVAPETRTLSVFFSPVFLPVVALRLCFLGLVHRESGALPRIIFPLDPFGGKKENGLLSGRTRVAWAFERRTASLAIHSDTLRQIRKGQTTYPVKDCAWCTLQWEGLLRTPQESSSCSSMLNKFLCSGRDSKSLYSFIIFCIGSVKQQKTLLRKRPGISLSRVPLTIWRGKNLQSVHSRLE